MGNMKSIQERSIVYNPEYKGVRLDIYAKDEHNTHYNVEMQVLPKPAVEKRARYMTFEEYIKEEREEAREEGRGEGELLLKIALIRKKIQRGKSLAETARELEEEVDVLRPIYDCILQNPDKDDRYILEQCQKQELGKSS